jgi:hypothetical protein
MIIRNFIEQRRRPPFPGKAYDEIIGALHHYHVGVMYAIGMIGQGIMKRNLFLHTANHNCALAGDYSGWATISTISQDISSISQAGGGLQV